MPALMCETNSFVPRLALIGCVPEVFALHPEAEKKSRPDISSREIMENHDFAHVTTSLV